MRVHKTPSPLAGSTQRIKATAQHHIYVDFAGAEIKIVDWFDRVYGKRVGQCLTGPIEAIVFNARWGRFLAGYIRIWDADELLVGLIGGRRHVVHISELDIQPDHNPLTRLPVAA